jgi:DNA polymerase-3 subunit delta'
MIPQIYGNDEVLSLIRTMRARDRMPHATLFFGERGMGRKTIARYFAMTALCTGENAPCGACPSCRKILLDDMDEVHPHPDLIWVEHSGKKRGFSVDTVRAVCRDAIVAPNDGDRKVYLFSDCDQMDIRAQNTLLKLTEEPPAHVLLVFTAEHRNAFLTTMLSRMMPIAVRPCTVADCEEAMVTQHECRPQDAARAAKACGGNIGRALQWLDSPEIQELTGNAARLTEAVAGHRQYEILRILSQYESDRQAAAELLRLLDLQLRDALAMHYDKSHLTGSDTASAEKLSASLTVSRTRRLHEAIQNAYDALQASVSVKLALAALGGALIS